jgi:hypothetical protein
LLDDGHEVVPKVEGSDFRPELPKHGGGTLSTVDQRSMANDKYE